MLKLTISGPPIPKARPRLGRNDNVFDPQCKVKNLIRRKVYALCQENDHKSPYESEVPIEIEMKFFCTLPKKNDKKFLNLFLWGCIKHTSKPDDDNLEKFYKDCLNKIVYHDDSQIVSTILKKEYSLNPRTEIKIMKKEISAADKVKDILSFINPDEFVDFSDDICIMASYLQNNESEPSEITDKIREEAACLISNFADRFSPILSKIAKKYPGAWKEFQGKNENTTA